MDSVPCLGCSEFFIPRNRSQTYCSKPGCQKARKPLWEKEKLKRPLCQDSCRLHQKKMWGGQQVKNVTIQKLHREI